jgi:hypothetical protein
MKILTLILVTFFYIQAIACAVPYNATIGPYTVSFDMGFSNYYFTESPWKATESLSGQKYEVGSVDVYKNSDHAEGIAIIAITHNDEDQSFLSPSASAKKSFGEVSDSATVRTIDGVSGSIATVKLDNGITICMAQYHPTFDPKRLNVSIVSNYPWDDGTLQLLKTIHIEKINATT